MDLFDLTGKAAIVTGGNGGIGLGLARGLAQAGAEVMIAGRDAGKVDAALADLGKEGKRVVGMVADVTDPAQVKRLVAETVSRLGGVDILVANAGINIAKMPEDYELDEWHRIIDANLTGAFSCCQAVCPEMRRRGGGKIVTIGSMTSYFGFHRAVIYGTSKGGIVQLTKGLAVTWARYNIQVNSILPGWVDTGMTQRARQAVPELHDQVVEGTPAGRWGEPADLVGAAVFLCSRASDFVTGVALPVDGGFSSSIF
jgi:2-dehydro-3-deoxy-D-gluconate 5-dehydrogenase